MPNPIACLDFEASSLPTVHGLSYPIEAGIAFVAPGDVRSWLIKPAREWLEAGYWDPNSEHIHLISLDQLQREGEDREDVQRHLARAVEGHVVVSDYAAYDAVWAKELFGGAPPFEVQDYAAVLYDRAGLPMIPFEDLLRDAETAALTRFPHRHRAGADAERLAEICRLVLKFA